MNRNGYGRGYMNDPRVDPRDRIKWQRADIYSCQNCPKRVPGGACCRSCARGGPCTGGGSSVKPQTVQYYGARPTGFAGAAAGGAAGGGGGGSTAGLVICMVIVGILLAAIVAVAVTVPSILLAGGSSNATSTSDSTNSSSSDTTTAAATTTTAASP